MQTLAAPESRFSVWPEQLMEYVDFLYMVGTIKARPRTWNDMFVPMLGDFRPS